jgi:hypothetical protein
LAWPTRERAENRTVSNPQYRAGSNELSGSSSELGVVQVLCVQTKSLFTCQLNTMNIPATHEQLERWLEGENMCVAMPDLKHDHIEFLVSGMTPQERRKRFGPLAVR